MNDAYQQAIKIIKTISPNLITNLDLVHEVEQNILAIENGFCIDSFSKQFNGYGNIEGYKYSRCRFLIFNFLTKSNKFSDFKEEYQHTVEEVYEDVCENLDWCKDFLTTDEQLLLEYRFIDGYTLKEIAEKYSCTFQNISLKLNNVLEKVKKHVQPMEEEE